MSDKKNQKTGQFGFGNKSKTTINQSIAKGQIVLTEEIYKQILENTVKARESEIKDAHNDEKIKLYEQIDGLQNKLANLPESLKKEQEKNAELVALLEQRESKVAEKKFEKAIDAIKENKFSKADKILTEIEDTEKLNKKEFGIIAYTRGSVAEKDVRWFDAAKHFARAAQIDPCYRNLILAAKFAIDTGDYDSALSFGEDAKKAAFKEHGEDSKEYATSLSSLGTVYYNKEQYKKAELIFEESLKIRQDVLGKKHPDVANSLNNLGGIYQKQEQYIKAKYFFKRALNINKTTLGVKHHHTAEILNNLGASYRRLGEFKKAKPLLKQALNIQEKIFGINHPHTATSFNNLGGIYYEQKKYKQALLMFQQALEIFEATLGPNHPDTKLLKDNYEILKKDLDNAEKPPSNNTGGLILNH